MAKILSLSLLLLAAQQSVAEEAAPSSPVTTAAPDCCIYQPWYAGLNGWWETTLTMTAATVITSILEYKESTVTTSSTIYNTDASSKLWSEIPGSLISGLFPSTVLTNQTAVTTGWGDQVVTAPTPYVTVGIVLYAPGSMVTESGTSSCKPADLGGPPYDYWSILDPPYVFIPTPTTQFRGPAMVTAPSGILDAWIDQEPTITEKYPLLPSCSPVSGTGEPVIHIPVSGVTEHSTTTIRKE